MRSKTALLFALPLALLLGSCSLISGNTIKDTQATRLLYVSQKSTGAVLAVDVESKSPFGEPITGLMGPGNMAVYGNYLYVVNESGNSVAEINRKNGQKVRSFQTGNDPRGIAITEDGAYLYVTNYGDGTVSRIYVPSGATEVISTSFLSQVAPHPYGVVATKLNNKYYAYIVNESPEVGSSSTTGYLTVLEGNTPTSVKIPGAQSMRNLALATSGSGSVPNMLYITDQQKAAIYRVSIATPAAPVPDTDVNPEGGSVTDVVAGPVGAKTAAPYFFATYRNNQQGVGGLTIRQTNGGAQAGTAKLTGGTSPTSIAIANDGGTLFVGAGSSVLWMDITTPTQPREPLMLKISDSQAYQSQAVTDIVAAPGVPNQR